MSVNPIGGLWTYPSTIFPQQNDYMFIDVARNRMITFVIMREDPPWRPAIKHWYKPETDTTITARLRPTEEWRTHEYDLQSNSLNWRYGGKVHEWRRVLWEQRPDWLEAELAKANLKMDETEKNT